MKMKEKDEDKSHLDSVKSKTIKLNLNIFHLLQSFKKFCI